MKDTSFFINSSASISPVSISANISGHIWPKQPAIRPCGTWSGHRRKNAVESPCCWMNWPNVFRIRQPASRWIRFRFGTCSTVLLPRFAQKSGKSFCSDTFSGPVSRKLPQPGNTRKTGSRFPCTERGISCAIFWKGRGIPHE